MGLMEADLPGGSTADALTQRVREQDRELAELRARLAEWEAAFSRLPERTDGNFNTISGVPTEPLYTPVHVHGDKAYAEQIGFPGEFPFTRGPYTSMYRTRLWTMRQFAGFGTAEETNARYHYLLDHGQTGLSVAFDFPTLMGYDSDHPRSLGEVGKCGVAISSLADMETLFSGIPLDQVSVSMTINGPAIILFCFYVIAAEKQGVKPEQLRGTVQNDILKEFMAQHAWVFPAEPALSLIVDMFEWCAQKAPKYNPISISGYHIREAGATAAQELAYTLRNGFEYVERGIERGLDVDDFAPRLSFFFDVHNEFFEEVAKFRAARRIWARHMREVYGAKKEESWRLRTQQVLAYETGVPNTIDPLAGSYYLEAMTDRLEREAEEIFQEVERLGGVVRGIEHGYFQREIALSAQRQQHEIEAGERLIVGVNAFEEGNQHSDIEILRIDDQPEARQRQRLAELRQKRDDARVKSALEQLRTAARERKNVVEPMLECVRSYATLYEIRRALEDVHGAYKEPIFF